MSLCASQGVLAGWRLPSVAPTGQQGPVGTTGVSAPAGRTGKAAAVGGAGWGWSVASVGCAGRAVAVTAASRWGSFLGWRLPSVAADRAVTGRHHRVSVVAPVVVGLGPPVVIGHLS